MAKRFNVSIPDALAERMEPFKNKISLSALMQASIERELARLTLTDDQMQRRSNFRTAAMNAWIKRYPSLTTALNAFIDNLIDQATNDGSEKIFDYYRYLWLAFNRSEVYPEECEEVFNLKDTEVHEIVSFNYTTRPDWAPPGAEVSYEELIDKKSHDAAYKMGGEFVKFLIDQKSKGISNLPDALFSQAETVSGVKHEEGNRTWLLDEDVERFLIWQYEDIIDMKKGGTVAAVVEDQPCCRLYYKALDSRIREIMDADDLCYILDFERPMLGLEGI
jgi:hypothetical protein